MKKQKSVSTLLLMSALFLLSGCLPRLKSSGLSSSNQAVLSGWFGFKQLGATTIGSASSGDDFVYRITTDALGNTLVVGTTNGSLFETNGGGQDVFVTKWNSNGAIVWKKQLGSITIGAGASGNEDAYGGIVTNSQGDVFIGGSTTGSLGEAAAAGGDVFVAKLSGSTGNVLWVRQLGNVTIGAAANGLEGIYSMKIDPVSGDLVATGHTNGSLYGAVGGALDIILLKFNSSTGAVIWGRQVNPGTLATATLTDRAFGLAINSSQEIFVAGDSTGSLGEANAGSYDVVLLKFDSSGNLLWTRQMGNVTIGASANASDNAKSLEIDTSGNLYISGVTQGSLGEAFSGGLDCMIAKYNAAGVFQWVRQMGNVSIGAGASGIDDASYGGIVIDSTNGHIYTSGNTNGSLGETSGGSDDGFYVKWSLSTGNFISVKQFGASTLGASSAGGEYCLSGLAIDTSNRIVMGCTTTGSIGETNASPGQGDVLIYRF